MKRSWIREANKYGVYVETRDGFRIYRVQDAIHQRRETETHIIDEYKSGKYVAIDKRGIKFATDGLDAMLGKINIQKIKDWCNR